MKRGLANAVHALQQDLIKGYPEDAVRLLETQPPAEVAEILSRYPVPVTTQVWERLSPDVGIQALEALSEARALEILRQIDPTRSAAMLAMRDDVLAAFGANLVLTPGEKGMPGAIAKAEEIAASDPDKYFMPDQFSNEYNKMAHYKTTAEEIWKYMPGHGEAAHSIHELSLPETAEMEDYSALSIRRDIPSTASGGEKAKRCLSTSTVPQEPTRSYLIIRPRSTI